MSEKQQSGVKIALVPSFFRYNATALTATTVDKSIAFGLHYLFGVDELIATPVGMSFGAVIAFFLGRNWTFMSTDRKVSSQGLRFLFITLGNMTLNWLMVWFLRDVVGMQEYVYMSLTAGVFVGLFFSFPMQRYFVYK